MDFQLHAAIVAANQVNTMNTNMTKFQGSLDTPVCPCQFRRIAATGLQVLAAVIVVLAMAPKMAYAQLESSPVSAPNNASPYEMSYGEPKTVKYQIGTKIKTGSSAFARVKVILPVPGEWPEQTVSVSDESIYEKAKGIEYRILDGGIRQMMVVIPSVPANTSAEVLVTYEVNVSPILAPQETSELTVPKKRNKEISMALGESPMISPRDRELRKLVDELVPDTESQAWETTRTLHAWVMENITETIGKVQSTEDTLETKKGCNEDRAALFIAMCRAAKIPARMVMVEGSQHAEFCLEGPDEVRRWYPCSFKGSGEFGSLSRAAVVFQKGDNLRMPEQKKRARLIAEYVNGRATTSPQVQIIRQVVQ